MSNNFFSLIHVYVLSYLLGNRNSSFGPMLKRLIKCFFFPHFASVLFLQLFFNFICCCFFLFASFVRALLKNMQSGIRQRVWHLSMTLTMPWDTQHTQDPRNGKDMFKLNWDFFTICLQWLLYSTWWLLIFLQAKKWIHRTGWR